MSNGETAGLMALIIIFILVIFGFFMWGYDLGQENGQVNCINGNIYYELVVKDDKTSSWEYIPRAERKGREKE